MASRDEIVAFLDELLDARGWPDHGPNGLQVPGSPEVGLVVSGVSAHAELFAAAAAAGAQMVLCHHGMFWEKGPAVMTEPQKARLEALFGADLSLVAYHLPLDAHADVGNNALICAALGLDRCEPFGEHRGRSIGWVGRVRGEGVSAAALVERATAAFGRKPLVFAEGPASVRSVGIVSGGGAGTLAEAVERGLDALVTGEPSEPAMADAREAGIHFVAGGHYATETFGVRRLGELIADRFGIEHRFVEVANPV
ncbi:MAG: Nif3-like dinuclear metal center hexameric protein [Thermoleophilaceae bacterium]|jgi:dinuclear metal center YbgI/SA1388 family protein|nr:Nif3-like dinuclear metal center hexameric protein [Thermoleophilaceae bacterium]